MKRIWTIVGVADVAGSFHWYQSLLGQPHTAPAHDYFGQIGDADGTVLLGRHKWGARSRSADTLIRYRPAWSPDSAYLAYSLDSSSTVEFYRFRDGAKVRVSVGGILKPQVPSNLAWIVLSE